MAASTTNTQRRSPSSLPRLTIPPSIAPTPELITPTSTSTFLSFCQDHGCAPPTAHDGLETVQVQDLLNAYNPSALARYEAYPSPTATILFTARDNLDLEDLTIDREKIKKEHTRWLSEMQKDPSNHRVMVECRYWREAREKLEQKVTALLDHKRVRRMCRRELNQEASKFAHW
ncbi:hypothetical protein F5X99DRAFT_429267 [Biscogniauxia marginata]|nr:hypothetical protein F5X99DRAFT_429267 [Biscogniauxia marginata]